MLLTQESAPGLVETLGWIDITSMAVLGIFFVLGIFKGLIWQVSRIATLVAAFVVAGVYGPDVGAWLEEAWGEPGRDPRTSLYIAYFAVFLAVLIALSLLAILIQKLVRQAGLSFFDRLGGGVLGLGTGAAVMVAVLGLGFMFLPSSTGVVQAAQGSYTYRYSQRAIGFLGETVPEPMREVFDVEPPEGEQAPEPDGEPREEVR